MSIVSDARYVDGAAMNAIVMSGAKTVDERADAAFEVLNGMPIPTLVAAAVEVGFGDDLRRQLAASLAAEYAARPLPKYVATEEYPALPNIKYHDDAQSTPAKPVKIEIPTAPVKSKPERSPSIGVPSPINWAELDEEDAKKKLADDEKRAKMLAGLSWADRCKIDQNKSLDELADDIQKLVESKTKKMIDEKDSSKSDDSTSDDKKSKSDEKKPVKKSKKTKPEEIKKTPEELAKYEKYHTETPARIPNPIRNAQAVTAQKMMADGYKVVGKQMAAATHTKNLHPEKVKRNTSAKWFFCKTKPILSEKEDWCLWDYDVVDGKAEPIGWVRSKHNPNEWKITKDSGLIHIRQDDGSWTHWEEYEDESGEVSRHQLTKKQLEYLLTPQNKRKGQYPSSE